MLDRRFLFCLALMVANDLVLKPTFGNWITGKLSDVVGVVVFAVVLAQVARAVGASNRASERVGVVLAGGSLVAVKVHAGAAASVVAVAERFGVGYQIVVDPTDLLALAALPLAIRILRNPQPIATNRTAARVVFGLACVACAASGTDGSNGYDYVERTDSGEVVLGQVRYSGETVPLVVPDPNSAGGWERTNQEFAVEWTLTTESCDPNNSSTCIRLGPGSRISVSLDGGQSYRTEWEVDDGAFWQSSGTGLGVGQPFLFEATDLEWSDDGRAIIAMSDRYPVIRRSNGTFTPSIGDLHEFPIGPFGFAAVAWLVAGAAISTMWGRRTVRGRIPTALAVTAGLVGSASFAAADGFGALAAILVIAPVGLVLALVGCVRVLRSGRESYLDVVGGRVSALDLLWPFAALLLLAVAWDRDWISFEMMAILNFVVVAVGAWSAWPTSSWRALVGLELPAEVRRADSSNE